MSKEKNLESIYNNFRRTGEALLRVNGNNTHSGNLSSRDPNDPDRFYITASGSQIGALIPRDIVPLSFSDVSWGDGRASTESNIHRKILSMPGANASIHCHHINSTLITFDTLEKQIFLRSLGRDNKSKEEFIFQPVDIHGSSLLGGVKAVTYKQPVGSAEMVEKIPKYLADAPLTLVGGHGPFTRGASLEECLQHLSILEYSSTLALSLIRRGVKMAPIQNKIFEQGSDSVFPSYPKNKSGVILAERNVEDDSTIGNFSYWVSYIYNMVIGAFGTGSMSQKVTSDKMIFCPMSSVPGGIDFPLTLTSTKEREDDYFELMLHKLIYNHTNYTTCIMAANPLVTAEGMAILAEEFGVESLLGESVDIPYSQKNHPVIAPIDAEAIYLNPRLGLVDITQLNNRSSENPILNMLRWHKGCCVVAGFGVIAVGDTTLEQAAHNVASAERIGKYRTEVFINEKLINGPSLKSFEPKTI